MKVSSTLHAKLNALDVNENYDNFIIKLHGIVEEAIEELKEEEKEGYYTLKCADCNKDYSEGRLSIYALMRTILSIARYEKPVCAECEKKNYIEKTHGFHSNVSNQNYKEAAIKLLTTPPKAYKP